MKIKIVRGASTLCSNPTGIHNYFGWPTVTRLRDGSLMAVASGFRVAHVCPFGKVVACQSFDEGKSWTTPRVIIDTPLDDRDAGIATFGERGIVITTFNNPPDFYRDHCDVRVPYCMSYLDELDKVGGYEKYLGSLISISLDGGVTFSEPVAVPISSPHGPIELQDGTVFYVGRLMDDDDPVSHVQCHTVSADGRATLRSTIANTSDDLFFCEPHAIQLPDGKIVVHLRVQDNGSRDGSYFTIFQSVSLDNGHTFTIPRMILSERGGAPAHLMYHSGGALISVYGYRDVPYGIRAMVSYDGGESWDTDNVLVSDAPSWDVGYPSSVELDNGDILTVYYVRDGKDGPSVVKQIVWNFERE